MRISNQDLFLGMGVRVRESFESVTHVRQHLLPKDTADPPNFHAAKPEDVGRCSNSPDLAGFVGRIRQNSIFRSSKIQKKGNIAQLNCTTIDSMI